MCLCGVKVQKDDVVVHCPSAIMGWRSDNWDCLVGPCGCRRRRLQPGQSSAQNVDCRRRLRLHLSHLLAAAVPCQQESSVLDTSSSGLCSASLGPSSSAPCSPSTLLWSLATSSSLSSPTSFSAGSFHIFHPTPCMPELGCSAGEVTARWVTAFKL